jgi:hypothetical protein
MSQLSIASARPRSRSPLSRDLRRALVVSLSVGTALVALNQGDLLVSALADAPLPATLAWKIPLAYLVPFLVSLGSSQAATHGGRAFSRGTARPE